MSITIERFERFPCRAETAPRKSARGSTRDQKLVSFHEIRRRGFLECEEERFWVKRPAIHCGGATASSSAFRLAPPEKTW